ncbi:MAG: TatD family hydrolase [Bacteroidales bacterium]|nr:TatD family hydrolase [Bacteroidales bacterium]MBN2763969.1 TatD family hydrolase [Bacteroidales bacterium]
MEPYIDIHTHTYYAFENARLLLNVFPEEAEKFMHQCYYSVGLHPWYVHTESLEKNLKWVEEQSENSLVLAVGEIGFDKIIDVPWKEQAYAFERQLDLAEKLSKPVIIHCVKAYNELIVYRNKSNQKIPWIFHWFNAGIEIAHELIRRNCYLSFGHMLFKENSRAFRSFAEIPLSSLFLETDDTGYTIKEIYDRAAMLKGISLSSLAKSVGDNFTKCFSHH